MQNPVWELDKYARQQGTQSWERYQAKDIYTKLQCSFNPNIPEFIIQCHSLSGIDQKVIEKHSGYGEIQRRALKAVYQRDVLAFRYVNDEGQHCKSQLKFRLVVDAMECLRMIQKVIPCKESKKKPIPTTTTNTITLNNESQALTNFFIDEIYSQAPSQSQTMHIPLANQTTTSTSVNIIPMNSHLPSTSLAMRSFLAPITPAPTPVVPRSSATRSQKEDKSTQTAENTLTSLSSISQETIIQLFETLIRDPFFPDMMTVLGHLWLDEKEKLKQPFHRSL